MKYRQNTIRTLRLTELTNTMVNDICDKCEQYEIYINGDLVSGSILFRYPFEQIAHSEYKNKKVDDLADLLQKMYKPTDKFGNFLSKNDIANIINGVI